MTREEIKKLHKKYRDKAEGFNDESSSMRVSINPHTTPVIHENGAFVEAIIWIPKELVED